VLSCCAHAGLTVRGVGKEAVPPVKRGFLADHRTLRLRPGARPHRCTAGQGQRLRYGRTFPIYEDSAMVPRRFIPDGGQPILTMYNAYRLYGFVQFCYQARKGYLVVNINEIEMQRATQAIKLVERKLSFGNADREAIWQRAVKANNGMTEGQNACEEVYRELLRYSGMPNYNPQRP
jgi:hypothetical protein